MDVYETRRANLRLLMTEWGGPTSLAAKLGHSNGSYLAQLAGPHPTREVSEKVARSVEHRLALPLGWLDQPHEPRREGLDDELLARCLGAVQAALEDTGVRLKREAAAEVVGLVYERAAERGGSIDEGYVKRLVRLGR